MSTISCPMADVAERRVMLERHARLHPAFAADDAVKLLFQSLYGIGHLLGSGAEARLGEEMRQTAPGDGALWEPIGGGLARLDLHACRRQGIREEAVFALMRLCESACIRETSRADTVAFLELCLTGTPYAGDAAPVLQALRDNPASLPSHSQAYRAEEAPAYRVILERDARFLLPLLLVYAATPHALCILDGPIASGKSTLAARLEKVIPQLQLVHMDDYCIPFARKTSERLAVPGGNADAERLEEEVLRPLREGRPGRVRRYNPHADAYAPDETVYPDRPILIEGNYCFLPGIRQYAAKTFYLLEKENVTIPRILRRNGRAYLAVFLEKWIPLEEAYREAYGLPAAADVIWEGSD